MCQPGWVGSGPGGREATILGMEGEATGIELAGKFPGAICDAENPMMWSSLMGHLAEYWARMRVLARGGS